jgi:hypothetical protein
MPASAMYVSLLQTSRPALGPTQPPIQWVSGIPSLSVKCPGSEINHSMIFSAEIKNKWSYNLLSLYVYVWEQLHFIEVRGNISSLILKWRNRSLLW